MTTPPLSPQSISKKYTSLAYTFCETLKQAKKPVEEKTLLKGITPDDLPLAKDLLIDLLSFSVLSKEGELYTLKDEKKGFEVEGILHVHPRGFGFVNISSILPSLPDIFIPRPHMHSGIEGDRVLATIDRNSSWEKGPEGKITTVLERQCKKVGVIIFFVDEEKGEILGHAPFLGVGQKVHVVPEKGREPLRIGDRVLLEVLDWGEESHILKGKYIASFGNIEDPASDLRAVEHEFPISREFSKELIEEVSKLSNDLPDEEKKNRKDYSSLTTLTIDPEGAKDHDDALSIKKTSTGYELGVHIADVAYYVTPDSLLDKEAKKRSNSTYFPSTCFPMLPEKLSNGLCSLHEGEKRLAMSIFMTLDAKGQVLNKRIERSIITVTGALTYEEARDILDHKEDHPYRETLDILLSLCLLLKEERSKRGSVDLSLPEIRILVNELGDPYDYTITEYDITHQMVEEFMLKANEMVITSLKEKGLPALFRIHGSPSPVALEDFYSLARALGFSLPKTPSQEDIQKMFQEAKNHPKGRQVSIAFIRSMQTAAYSNENIGHYGLALENYCHATSPIRRYADLIIQRLLFEGYIPKQIQKIADQCSEKERISFRAESHVNGLKKIRLLQKYHRENPDREYQATVTKVKPFGISFDVAPLMVGGFIHVSHLHKDYFVYHAPTMTLKGKHTGITYSCGKEITIFLESIDLTFQETQWKLTSSAEGGSPTERNRSSKRPNPHSSSKAGSGKSNSSRPRSNHTKRQSQRKKR